jgi:hypothetical protein
MSAVFLNLNFLVLVVYLFFNLPAHQDLSTVLREYMNGPGEALDPEREGDLTDEVIRAKGDPKFFPTRHDLVDLCTIGKISPAKMMQVFGAGFQGKFKRMHSCKRFIVNLMFTMIYVGSLGSYAWIIWHYDEADSDDKKSKLGIATACCVGLCDTFLGLLYHSKIIKRLSLMTSLAIISRVLIFGGGKDAWLYGYMLYFVLFASIISWTISRIHFPYATAISEDKMADASNAVKKQVDVTQYPEFILVFSAVSYVISIAMISSFRPKGVTPPPLTAWGRTLNFTSVCVVSLFCCITIFFALNLRRIFYRNKHNLKRKVNYYIANKRFGIFEIYSLCLYICMLFWSFIFYWVSRSYYFVAAGCIVPLIVYYFSQGWLNFLKNDCEYFRNIKKMNVQQNKHNQELLRIKEQAKEIQESIIKGEYKGVH